MNRKTVAPTFWQLYADHVRPRGSLLLGDVTLMLFVFLPPAMLQTGLKLSEELGSRPEFLHAGEMIDGVWLLLAVGLICFDSTGKLLTLSISGWRAALQKKP